jgi:hypothetical protein
LIADDFLAFTIGIFEDSYPYLYARRHSKEGRFPAGRGARGIAGMNEMKAKWTNTGASLQKIAT